MIVDARRLHLVHAQRKLSYATREYLLDDLTDVEDEGLRAYYLRNRLLLACRIMGEALEHLRLAATCV